MSGYRVPAPTPPLTRTENVCRPDNIRTLDLSIMTVYEQIMILWFFGVGLFAVLVALAVIDFRTMTLPDILTLPLMGFGLAFAYWQGIFVGAIIGAVIGYAGLVALELAYKKFRGVDGLGRGDAKLLAAGGAWCGWAGLPFILLIASAFGLVHALMLSRGSAEASNKLPFGPHLAVGIFLTWVALSI